MSGQVDISPAAVERVVRRLGNRTEQVDGGDGVTLDVPDEDCAEAAATLRALAAEVDRLRRAAAAQDRAVCQSLGDALGYPTYAADPRTFPDASPEDGCCVGPHTAETLATEAAETIRRLREALSRRPPHPAAAP